MSTPAEPLAFFLLPAGWLVLASPLPRVVWLFSFHRWYQRQPKYPHTTRAIPARPVTVPPDVCCFHAVDCCFRVACRLLAAGFEAGSRSLALVLGTEVNVMPASSTNDGGIILLLCQAQVWLVRGSKGARGREMASTRVCNGCTGVLRQALCRPPYAHCIATILIH